MELIEFIKTRRWPTVLGYLLFIGMMATGYYYNVTFVQLGLVDLGTRLIGMSQQAVALHMGLLAVLTCVIGLGVGLFMKQRGWSLQFFTKLRLAFLSVLVQTLLTAVAPFIGSELGLLLWVVAASGALGIGVPATFGLTVDLIPVRDRGYVAAIITSLAYLAANIYSTQWRIERFSAQILWLMVLGTIGIGVLAFKRFGFTEQLAIQHRRPEFGLGRFVQVNRRGQARVKRSLYVLIGLMFGVFFIDSLGFLRLIATPLLVESAWQSPELARHVLIGGTHAVAAIIGGVLYAALDERNLFLWIFGLFGMVHLMYGFSMRAPLDNEPALAMPILYATAVSLYTVLNFAIWADVSTPRTISLHAALGVALSGWASTFISTALAIRWEIGALPLMEHLQVVGAISMLFFLVLLVVSFFGSGQDLESQTG
jgi:MFS family permease